VDGQQMASGWSVDAQWMASGWLAAGHQLALKFIPKKILSFLTASSVHV